MLKECCLLRHVNISESQAVGWRSACMQWFGPVQIWTLSVHWGSGDARASYFQLLFLFSSLLISFKPVNILLSEVGKSDGRGAELLYLTQPGLTDGDRRLFLREKTRKKQAEEFHGCFANIVGQLEFYLYAVHLPSRNHRSIFFLSGVSRYAHVRSWELQTILHSPVKMRQQVLALGALMFLCVLQPATLQTQEGIKVFHLFYVK